MAGNLADEIRAQEAAARNIVMEAKAEAAKQLATARAAAEQSVKDAKQRQHRFLREQVAAEEKIAEAAAIETVEKGRKDAEQFYADRRFKVDEVANWLVKEVMATHGVS